MKNTHEGVLLLVKLQAFSLVCDFTKSNTPPWVFFVFFKSYKWHQIAQRNIYLSIQSWIQNAVKKNSSGTNETVKSYSVSYVELGQWRKEKEGFIVMHLVFIIWKKKIID